ncbi:MAG: hypothetical protein HY581_05530 [Nitrospirae bacterium]|nr:hypothetical protein [Nitrospirota bacterium]
MRRSTCERWWTLHPLPLTVFLALLLIASDGLARPGDLIKPPTEVVKQYISLDMKGARLEAMSKEVLKPYINWKDEPAWGQVVVIESYTVPDDVKRWEIISATEAIIPVEFKVLGSVYLESAAFLPETRTERVRFRVKAVIDRWRIMEPLYPPHVGQKRMLNHVRQAMLQETDASHLAKLTELRDELKKIQR